MIIDTAVHPVLGDKELYALLDEPWASGQLPHPMGARYALPGDGFTPLADGVDDPGRTARFLFDTCGVDIAVLTPSTRGLRPNPHEQTAIAHATNEWLAQRWLDHPEARGRFVASIRLPMTDVKASLAELSTWADDPRFVQVVVPLRTILPYGDEYYLPIWKAVAALGLPVGVYDDASTGVAHVETPVGPPRFFAEKHVLKPMAPIVHFSSMITGGVFDRVPELRVVFGDGSVDLSQFLLWKIEKDWRAGRGEIPWVEKLPGKYTREHVRYVSQAEDGLIDGENLSPELLAVTDAKKVVVFGSHYPLWDFIDPRTALEGWEPDARTAVLAENYLAIAPRLAAYVDDLRGAVPATAPADH